MIEYNELKNNRISTKESIRLIPKIRCTKCNRQQRFIILKTTPAEGIDNLYFSDNQAVHTTY
jgi:hypothetical protein